MLTWLAQLCVFAIVGASAQEDAATNAHVVIAIGASAHVDAQAMGDDLRAQLAGLNLRLDVVEAPPPLVPGALVFLLDRQSDDWVLSWQEEDRVERRALSQGDAALVEALASILRVRVAARRQPSAAPQAATPLAATASAVESTPVRLWSARVGLGSTAHGGSHATPTLTLAAARAWGTWASSVGTAVEPSVEFAGAAGSFPVRRTSFHVAAGPRWAARTGMALTCEVGPLVTWLHRDAGTPTAGLGANAAVDHLLFGGTAVVRWQQALGNVLGVFVQADAEITRSVTFVSDPSTNVIARQGAWAGRVAVGVAVAWSGASRRAGTSNVSSHPFTVAPP